MEKWADYCITKYEYREDVSILRKIEVRIDNGNTISDSFEMYRRDILEEVKKGKTFCTIIKNTNGRWNKQNDIFFPYNPFHEYSISISKDNHYIDNLGNIPLILPKRKVFISYYNNDQTYKDDFENLTNDIIINKSVGENEIDDDNSTDYIKSLIQKKYLNDTTIVICLVGPNTKHRKHVDWELSGGLDYKVGNTHAGLIGVLLPNHPDYGKSQYYNENLPKRLARNAKSGYALIIDWNEDVRSLQDNIEKSFNSRAVNEDKIVNREIPQMQKNTN